MSKFSIIKPGLAWLVVLSFGRMQAAADPGAQDAFFGITDEDDAYTYPWTQHTDRHYTHGLKFSYMDSFAPATGGPEWLGKILGWDNWSAEASSWGGVLGQNMYTPQDLLTPVPIPTDRPYAGWLYAGPVYQREGMLSSNLFVEDSFEADLGVVGPDSFAGNVQEAFHQTFFPDDVPQGWHNQIHNEPGVVLKYERSWRYSPTEWLARYVDVIPHTGFDLGNVFTWGTAGLTGRFGWNLPPDFGEATIDSSGSVNSGLTGDSIASAYVFTGVDERAVAQNITLDGSWFQSDPSVSQNTWVTDVSYGFAVRVNPHVPCLCAPRWLPQLEFAFTHIDRSREFRGQQGDDIFGSATVKLSWCVW
jgi:hypothetical protein